MTVEGSLETGPSEEWSSRLLEDKGAGEEPTEALLGNVRDGCSTGTISDIGLFLLPEVLLTGTRDEDFLGTGFAFWFFFFFETKSSSL